MRLIYSPPVRGPLSKRPESYQFRAQEHKEDANMRAIIIAMLAGAGIGFFGPSGGFGGAGERRGHRPGRGYQSTDQEDAALSARSAPSPRPLLQLSFLRTVRHRHVSPAIA